VAETTLVVIASDVDVVTARQAGRELAAQVGFSPGDQTVIAAAISEIARNILMYARRGEVELRIAVEADRSGVIIVASDQGPGIPDIEHYMQDGVSTSGGLGLGLGGSKRLVDDFHVDTSASGTKITMKKWRRRV
jgi:serine/threonine-protein kinase RsbT